MRRVFVAYETVDRRNPVQRQAEIHRLEFPRVTPASQKCGASSRLRERPFEMFPRGGAKWAEHERYCDSIRTFPYLNVDCCLVIRICYDSYIRIYSPRIAICSSP